MRKKFTLDKDLVQVSKTAHSEVNVVYHGAIFGVLLSILSFLVFITLLVVLGDNWGSPQYSLLHLSQLGFQVYS